MTNSNIPKDHPVLAVGFTIFVLIQAVMYILSKYFKDLDSTPTWVQASLIICFLISILLVTVGGFLQIGSQGGAKNTKQYFSVFFKGFWQAAKLPILITLIIFIGLGLLAIFQYLY